MPIALLIILALVGFAIFCYISYKLKQVKFEAIGFISGAVKSGKSTLGVYFALKDHKRAHRRWRVRCILARLRNKPLPEEPLLYSNIPLSVPHVRLTLDLLLRNTRFAYKSTLLVDESSLVADSQMIRDKDVNNALLLLWKLWGHETHGGHAFINSQSWSDSHYSVRRCISTYVFVYRCINIPFLPFLIFKLIEQRYSEDGSVVAVDTEDVEDKMKTMVIWKSVWKKFDCYTYSVFTDHLQPERTLVRDSKDLKTTDIVSFDPERLRAIYQGQVQYRKALYSAKYGAQRPESVVSKDTVQNGSSNCGSERPCNTAVSTSSSVGQVSASTCHETLSLVHTPLESKKEEK